MKVIFVSGNVKLQQCSKISFLTSSEWFALIYPRMHPTPQTLQGLLGCGLEQSVYHTACPNVVKGVGVCMSNDVRNPEASQASDAKAKSGPHLCSERLGVFMRPEFLYMHPKPQPALRSPHPIKMIVICLFYGAYFGIWGCFKELIKQMLSLLIKSFVIREAQIYRQSRFGLQGSRVHENPPQPQTYLEVRAVAACSASKARNFKDMIQHYKAGLTMRKRSVQFGFQLILIACLIWHILALRNLSPEMIWFYTGQRKHMADKGMRLFEQ